jgi:DeoR/GlpR family transcriptional regulator of sugar metabolism
MLKEERHNFIINEVSKYNRVLLTDLAQKLEVSDDTVRRDLKELDALDKIKKVHGGAVSKSYNIYNYTQPDIYAREEKILIAQKAHRLLHDNQVILISGGTTNLEFARLIPKNLKATFFTPSLPTALQLLNHPNSETIFIGGKISREMQLALGGSVINTLSQIKTDLCLIGTGHLDAYHGLSEFDWEVVQLKKAMIKASKKVVALTISEKLNSSQRYRVCEAGEIDYLITELDPKDAVLQPYINQGVTVL